MFQLLLVITFFIGNYLGFRLTLGLLKVKEKINKRSLFLAVLFLTVQVVSSLVVSSIGLVEPAGMLLSMVIFGFILRKYLILKMWQLIVIPIGVSGLSSLTLGVGFMISISLFGPISVG